ncbi:MAG: MobV family relaxase [Bacillota bacterium]
MPYCIFRFKKHHVGAIAPMYRHNERTKSSYESNPDIDPTRKQDNYYLIAPKQSYYMEIERLIKLNECRRRSNSVLMVETIISVTPEYFDRLPAGEQKEFFQSVTDFMKQRIGEQNILSAIVHMDETSPHMHLCFCPITKDGRLCAKDILGNAKALAKWQDDIFEHVHERWPEFERGEPARETGRKHIPTWLFKKAHKLDMEAERIVAALSDINAFNAGKKKEAALAIIAEWLPEARKFTAQIGSVDSYISDVKREYKAAEVFISAENLALKDKVDELDKAYVRSQREAYELRETLRKQKKLIDLIPKDVLDSLKQKPRLKEK